MRKLFDLRLQLLAFYILLAIPLLLSLLLLNQVARTRIRQNAEASNLSLTQAIAQETAGILQDMLQAMEQLASYQAVRQADAEGMRPLFRLMLLTHPQVNLVYRLDARGIMLYHYPEGPGSTVGTDFSFRDYFQRALTTHSPLLSQGRISPTTGQAVTTAVMPLWSERGEFQGLIGANIRLESLSEALTAIRTAHPPESDLQLLILDHAQQIIAHPDTEWLLKPANALLPLVVLNQDEQNYTLLARAPSGEERLYTAVRLPSLHWMVILSQPSQVVFATQIALERLTFFTLLTFLLIGLFFWWVLAVRVIQPIERLVPFSAAIGDNRPISEEELMTMQRLARRRDQIGHLIRSILHMRESLAERFREQNTLLETSAAVVSSLDIDTVLDRILEQMARLLKVERCAIIALDERRGVFRVRASRGLSARYVEQLTIQPSEPDSVAMRALHSGEPIFVSDTETDPSYVRRRATARAEGHRAILAVPLKTKYAPPTVLVVYHSEPHTFTYNEIRLLTTFANHATMAIENAILFERSDMQLEEQTHRLQALMESLDVGILLGNLQDRVIYVNRRMAEWLHQPQSALQNRPLAEILKELTSFSPDPQSSLAEIQALVQGHSKSCELTYSADGRESFLWLETFDVTDDQATSIGRGILVRDATAERELDRMKSSLISTVSHELRTPLAAIKGYASTLLADDVHWDEASQREFLTIISQEADRLSNLVNNLLDLSRLEAGTLKLSFQPCDATTLIENAVSQSHLPPTVHLERNIQPNLPPILGDRLRLETVLRNLLDNAVKYAGTEAHIRISAQREENSIVFRVSDNGPGIPAAERERIFESFYRVESGLTRTASGAGLGLSICHGLVRAHGGKIWVEAPEKGASIAFSIPLETETAAEKGIV